MMQPFPPSAALLRCNHPFLGEWKKFEKKKAKKVGYFI